MVVVADFHCDLLSFLAENPFHRHYDEKCRCSIPFLKKGNVLLQVCALFTETNSLSVTSLKKQVRLFESLLADGNVSIKEGYPEENDFNTEKRNYLHLSLSIENASGLCLETDPVSKFEIRLTRLLKKHSLSYLGLVWNHDNRFCGAAASSCNQGLSDEGKAILRILDKYSIPVDVSHASDKTIEDIFNFIEINQLTLIPIASHSNFREICSEKRNLPRDFAQEIARKGGVIGLNFYQKFVGNNFRKDFLRHIFYASRILGNLNSICFGSDFFYSEVNKEFNEEFGNAGCFPRLETFLSEYLSSEEIQKLFNKNLISFLCRNVSPIVL